MASSSWAEEAAEAVEESSALVTTSAAGASSGVGGELGFIRSAIWSVILGSEEFELEELSEEGNLAEIELS